jgi:hypothetical protein
MMPSRAHDAGTIGTQHSYPHGGMKQRRKDAMSVESHASSYLMCLARER